MYARKRGNIPLQEDGSQTLSLITSSKFSRFTSGTLSFDAPRIAAGGFYLIGSAKIGNFRESRTIVGCFFCIGRFFFFVLVL